CSGSASIKKVYKSPAPSRLLQGCSSARIASLYGANYTHSMGAKHLLNLIGNRLHTLPLVVLYLTDGCNSRCVTCDIWRNPRRNMPVELVEQVAAEARPLGIRWAILSG